MVKRGTKKGVKAGQNVASQFKRGEDFVWRLDLAQPLAIPKDATLTVGVKDRAGNVTRIERTFR